MNNNDYTNQILQNAKITLERYLLEYKVNKPCAIFDIDDTLFFTGDEPNEPVISFYRYIESIGIPIFILTARVKTPENIQLTVDLLRRYGLKYEDLIMRNPSENDLFKFKSDAREYIQRVLKYTNLISVGDMVWDVNTYVHIPVLLPNKNNLYIPYMYNLL